MFWTTYTRTGCETCNRLICTAKCPSRLITLQFRIAGHQIREVHCFLLSPGWLIRRQHLIHPANAKLPSLLASSQLEKTLRPHLWPVISVALALHFTCFVLNFWTKSSTIIPYWSCARKKIISVANYLQHLKQGSPRAVPVTSRIKELVSKDHLIRVPVLNALQSCGCAVKGYSWVCSLPYEFRCSFREDFMEKSLEAVGGMKSLAASFSLREERCQGMSCQPVR